MDAPTVGAVPADAGGSTVVERHDVEAVNRQEERQLYQKRQRIHPRRARGTFRRLKWAILALALAVYYLAPWLRWERGVNAPDQAILLDLPGRRFYFFFIEIWPQEVYYITGLLIIAALALFLITSLAGRVWCGYTCPQTVWTDLFIAIERFVEGDRAARIRLDMAPWGGSKIARKLVKHGLWLIVAAATGGAWVFYFADAPTLLPQLFTGEAPAVSYTFIAILTGTTYLLGAIAREQVCIYMCPWPRIQGAMLDEHSLVVTYHKGRGEPRGPYRRGDSWDGRGDCVSCRACVVVCPMGIDIRDGQQLECINCALCIDACNEVMGRLKRPGKLISYDTIANIDLPRGAARKRFRLLRPRIFIYLAAIVVVGLVMLGALLTRDTLDVSVLRDRNPLFVMLSDGSVRNGYTVKILNKFHEARRFRLRIEGLEGATLAVVGAKAGDNVLTVEADRLRAFRIFLSAKRSALAGSSVAVDFVLEDLAGGEAVRQDSSFRGPEK